MDLAIGGVGVAALIFGVVEAAKEFGVKGRGSQVLALFLGVFFVGLARAGSLGLIPAHVLPWIELAVYALSGGLAAMGYYDFGKKFRDRVRILPVEE